MLPGIKKWWDSHCNRCGLCCYEKIRQEDGSWVIDLSNPCPWLDRKTHLCTVYENRFKVNPRCRRITVFSALFSTYLPPSCGYVRNFRPGFFPASRVVLSETVED
ncbi:MAG: hypothetical protein DRP60_02815 [Spirochaetes bacterium]|nr:MAG: hypothetical protein DRP60_02815 [Spirochaetota bacterium]